MALYPSWRKLRQRMPSLWWMVSGLDHGQYAQTGQQGNLQPKVMVMIIIIICYILFWILLGMLLISWKIFSETVFELTVNWLYQRRWLSRYSRNICELWNYNLKITNTCLVALKEQWNLSPQILPTLSIYFLHAERNQLIYLK